MQHDYSTDFGGYIRRKPARVFEIRAAADYRDALQRLNLSDNKTDVRIRGAAHTSAGQTLVEQGAILRNFNASRTPDRATLSPEGTLRVSSRSAWYAVERFLNRRGRSIPVLTDYLWLSVGGTVSIGGIGVDSIRHGLQVDHIRSLRLLDGNGRSYDCSRTSNAELFKFALGGMGRIGFIESVSMETIPLHSYEPNAVRRFEHIEGFLEYMAAQFGGPQSPSIPDAFNAYWNGAQIFAESAFRSTKPGVAAGRNQTAFDLHRRRKRWLSQFPDALRIWTDYVFDLNGLIRFLNWITEIRHGRPFAGVHFTAYILVIKRPAHAIALPLLPIPPGTIRFSVGLYGFVNRLHPFAFVDGMAVMRQVQDKALALNGVPYRHGYFEASNTLEERLYGEAIKRLKELRSEYAYERINVL